MRWAALALVALALTGCETTAEKSAKLEKVAERQQREAIAHGKVAQKGLSITRQSTRIEVSATAILHTSEGAAALVTLHNSSAIALRDIPIEITVKDAHGAVLYTNDAPGLGAGLTSAALIPAHGSLVWIDDQVQVSATPTVVSAKVGEGVPTAGAAPRLVAEGMHLIEDPSGGTGAEGSLVNHSRVSQQELIVYAVARHAGRIVAAARAVLPTAAAGASTPVQLFFVGNPQGARLEVSAPPTTLG